METNNEAVVVAGYNSVEEAQIYKALLESAGVQTRMQNDIAAQVMPVFGSQMQVNLLVAPDDENRAREILAARFDSEAFTDESENNTYESDL